MKMGNNFVGVDRILETRRNLAEAHSGCKVIFTGLFGSQNYGLDDSNSDVDCVCVVLPTLNNLIDSAPISKEIATDNGKINLVDIRNFAKQLESGSFVNLETLFSRYCIVYDEFKEFHSKRYDIYMSFHSEFKRAVYFCTRNAIKKINNAQEDKKCKLIYEALRFGYLYKKIREESFCNLNFYVDDLRTRCELGFIKCGDLSFVGSKINELSKYLDENNFDSEVQSRKNNFSARKLAKDIILNSVIKKSIYAKENI